MMNKKEDSYTKLLKLLEANSEFSDGILNVTKGRAYSYRISDRLLVKEILPIWRKRASWNLSVNNAKSGSFNGLEALVEKLEQMHETAALSHEITSGVNLWTVFTDDNVSQIYGVISKTPAEEE
jgi:hypothetical protein